MVTHVCACMCPYVPNVCMYVCVWIMCTLLRCVRITFKHDCVHVHTACTHTCVYACVCVYVHHVCVRVYIYMNVCVCTMCVCCVYVHVCMIYCLTSCEYRHRLWRLKQFSEKFHKITSVTVCNLAFVGIFKMSHFE